jgi:hypothetical protein
MLFDIGRVATDRYRRFALVGACAAALSIDPIIVVVALLARAAGASDRSAQRLARAILGSTQETTVVEDAMREMGLHANPEA